MSQPIKSWAPTALRIFVACGIGLTASFTAFVGIEGVLDRRDTALAIEVARARAVDAPAQTVEQLPEVAESHAIYRDPRRLEWIKVEDRARHQVKILTVDLSQGDLRSSNQATQVIPFFSGIALLFGFCFWLLARPTAVVWRDEALGVSLERWSVETAEVVQSMAGRVRTVVKESKAQRRMIAEILPQIRGLQIRMQSYPAEEVLEFAAELSVIQDRLIQDPEQSRVLSEAIVSLTERLKTHLEQVEVLERKLRG